MLFGLTPDKGRGPFFFRPPSLKGLKRSIKVQQKGSISSGDRRAQTETRWRSNLYRCRAQVVVGTAIVPMPCGNILPPPAAWSSHTFMMLIPLLLMRFRDTMKPLDIQCVRAHCSGTYVDKVPIKHFYRIFVILIVSLS